MAKIEVQSAFVEDVLTGDNGVWALKTAEPHSRKNDRDQWETVSRTFRTVRVSRGSGIDLNGFAKGDRITFTGSEKTDVREYQGKKYYDLLVFADSISRVEGRGTSQDRAGQPQTGPAGDWATAPTGGAQNAFQGGGGFGDTTPF